MQRLKGISEEVNMPTAFVLINTEIGSESDVLKELKKIADERWGIWKGYAFVYVLNDLPALSEKVGVNLTTF